MQMNLKVMREATRIHSTRIRGNSVLYTNQDDTMQQKILFILSVTDPNMRLLNPFLDISFTTYKAL